MEDREDKENEEKRTRLEIQGKDSFTNLEWRKMKGNN